MYRAVDYTAAVGTSAAQVYYRPPATAQALLYRVRSGDTLSSISQRFYGHAADWPSIYWANTSVIRWANDLSVGWTLRIPALSGHLRGPPRQLAPAPRYVAPVAVPITRGTPVVATSVTPDTPLISFGNYYSFAGLEALWVGAGGPAAVEWEAATIAECESGGNRMAYNPSGASGLWQILGDPFPGDPFNPYTNARMAVAKYDGAGDSFAPWVCQA